jgi:predicted O-linked N-acetylglucosamine transferase (SPINDLY family)
MNNVNEPLDIFAALQLALKFYHTGELRKSVPICEQILSIDPDNTDALHLLALVAHQMGKNKAAVWLIEKAIGINNTFFSYHNTAGNVYHALNKPDVAIACYNRAIALKPDYHEAYNNLGVALLEQGKLGEAAVCFHRALALKSDFYEAHNNMGNALKEQGKLDEAIAHYNRAIALKPDYHEARNNLGVALLEQGKLEEAAVCFHRALALKSDFYKAHNNMGNALKEQGKLDEAVAHYNRAIALKPDYHEAYNNLGNVLNKLGKFEEAKACYQKALELKDNYGIRIKLAVLLPAIMPSRKDISLYRRQIDHSINNFLPSGDILNDPLKDVGQTNFYLAYHGINNRDLQVKIAKLYITACPSLLYVSPHCKNGKRVEKPGKIKIGFISSNFHNIAIGKHFRGVIANLSRELFEVYVFFGKKKSDAIAQFIEKNADISVTLVSALEIARKQIAECELDILFYTDIGMDPLTYFLSFSRLAPVQCVTWGHPDTTGIPNIDYFISCEDFETEGSETEYSEPLVRMKNIPNYFYRPDTVKLSDAQEIRKRMKLPKGNRLYVVPQTLFKFHPDFDAVLGEILRRDSNGLVILFEAAQKALRSLLMNRFSQSIPDVTERIIFLPFLSSNDFFSFISNADAVLDTPYFCGGTTSLEMFSVGCPIVTWPGRRMASRFTYAYYKKMGVMDLVCEDSEQYVQRAVRLANDAAWKKQISEKILERNGLLYNNLDSVRELEQFLLYVSATSK